MRVFMQFLSTGDSLFFIVSALVSVPMAFVAVYLARHPESLNSLDPWLRRHPRLYAWLERQEKKMPRWIDDI